MLRRGPLPISLNDAPAAFRRSLQEYLANSDVSQAKVGLQYSASSFVPCSYFIFREEGGVAGASSAHIDEISGCGGRDVLSYTKASLEARFGQVALQESSFPRITITREFSRITITRGA